MVDGGEGQTWSCAATPLLEAVQIGDIELARLLLRAGADTTVRDATYQLPPVGWAHYFGRADLAALIEGAAPVSDGPA